jgi:hypothetical protein
MNVYQVNVEPKAVQGAGIGGAPGYGRTFTVVTGTLQDAMSIARGHVGDKEQITGIYVTSSDVIVDYSQVTGQNC